MATRRRAADALETAEAARTRAEALDTRTAWADLRRRRGRGRAGAAHCRERRIGLGEPAGTRTAPEVAAEAAQREQRRRIREGFARETQGTRWFEGLIERKNEDYEVAYAALRVRHYAASVGCGNQPVSRPIGERPHRHAVVLTRVDGVEAMIQQWQDAPQQFDFHQHLESSAAPRE